MVASRNHRNSSAAAVTSHWVMLVLFPALCPPDSRGQTREVIAPPAVLVAMNGFVTFVPLPGSLIFPSGEPAAIPVAGRDPARESLARESSARASSPDSHSLGDGSARSSGQGEWDALPFPAGHVIWDGKYCRAPHQVAGQGEAILLNGRLLPPLVRGMGGDANWNRRNRRLTAIERVESVLEQNGLILVDENRTYLFPENESDFVLATLASTTALESRVTNLLNFFSIGPVPGSQLDWEKLVGTFDGDDQLREMYADQPVAAVVGGDFYEDPQTLFSTGTLRYLLTVGGMGLGVVGFGMLLQHRPHARGQRQRIDRDGDGFYMLPSYVLLLVLFAGFDLICTLMARGNGSLLELNPAGSALLTAPWTLACVKLSATLLSAWILLRLRSYRIAQTACWWMCLLSVFLMMRWVSFNSMFLT